MSSGHPAAHAPAPSCSCRRCSYSLQITPFTLPLVACLLHWLAALLRGGGATCSKCSAHNRADEYEGACRLRRWTLMRAWLISRSVQCGLVALYGMHSASRSTSKVNSTTPSICAFNRHECSPVPVCRAACQDPRANLHVSFGCRRHRSLPTARRSAAFRGKHGGVRYSPAAAVEALATPAVPQCAREELCEVRLLPQRIYAEQADC